MSTEQAPTQLRRKRRCQACGSANIKVIDSRPSDAGSAIRRRRECGDCKVRWTTYETWLSSLSVTTPPTPPTPPAEAMSGAFMHGENLRYLHRQAPIVLGDGEILAEWKRGSDTFDIAKRLHVHESEIANRLTHIRMRERDA